ncbi:hypothetical protein ACFQEX_22795 [Roseibium salinum]|uniref:hypothetical protein n=1 Tax=Roseibium salinum TaxID=1604349 RepID=UPI00361F01CF
MDRIFHPLEFEIFLRRHADALAKRPAEIIAVIGNALQRLFQRILFQRVGGKAGGEQHDLQRELPLVGKQVPLLAPAKERIVQKGKQQHHELMMLHQRRAGGGGHGPVMHDQRMKDGPVAQFYPSLQMHLIDEVRTAEQIQGEVLGNPGIIVTTAVNAVESFPRPDQHRLALMQHEAFLADPVPGLAGQAEHQIMDGIDLVDPPGLGMLHANGRARQPERKSLHRDPVQWAMFAFIHVCLVAFIWVSRAER